MLIVSYDLWFGCLEMRNFISYYKYEGIKSKIILNQNADRAPEK
jgi:hypothetical protein